MGEKLINTFTTPITMLCTFKTYFEKLNSYVHLLRMLRFTLLLFPKKNICWIFETLSLSMETSQSYILFYAMFHQADLLC